MVAGVVVFEHVLAIEADGAQVNSLDQTVRDQLALSRSLQAAAESMQGRLLATEAALAGMSSQELDAGGELDLAEVDYLLRLANERLKLFSDPVHLNRNGAKVYTTKPWELYSKRLQNSISTH